jgi:hypothetical protein
MLTSAQNTALTFFEIAMNLSISWYKSQVMKPVSLLNVKPKAVKAVNTNTFTKQAKISSNRCLHGQKPDGNYNKRYAALTSDVALIQESVHLHAAACK